MNENQNDLFATTFQRFWKHNIPKKTQKPNKKTSLSAWWHVHLCMSYYTSMVNGHLYWFLKRLNYLVHQCWRLMITTTITEEGNACMIIMQATGNHRQNSLNMPVLESIINRHSSNFMTHMSSGKHSSVIALHFCSTLCCVYLHFLFCHLGAGCEPGVYVFNESNHWFDSETFRGQGQVWCFISIMVMFCWIMCCLSS